jgi:carotenoid cleavage dioxygenase
VSNNSGTAIHRQTNSNGAPLFTEYDATSLRIQGELPDTLNGTLYRNGPNPQFHDPKAHLFGGDGMVHAFTLNRGQASYCNRWVRTAHWRAEREAGQKLFDAYGRDKNGSKTAIAADEGAANTNVIWHGGRLMALEEAHLPIEMDPHTLETRGVRDYGQAIKGPFTAHPKIDPVTGEMVFFGYSASGPLSAGMTYGVVDAKGVVTRFERFEAPYASMIHDFMITARHVLFPVLPLTGSMARAQRGQPPFAWEPEMGARIGIMSRNGSAQDIRWFSGNSCYVYHVMNAWESESGDRIIADVMRYDEPPLFTYPDGTPTDPSRTVARLCRWTFDLAGASDTFTEEFLSDLPGEFPRIDDRRTGLSYRHGWGTCDRLDGQSVGHDGLVHYDILSGKQSTYMLPVGDKFSEPVFVPSAVDAPEGDGWLLSTIFRATENRSDLAVFGATDLAAGPVATVQLSHRVPAGFHGNWVGA